MRAFSVHSSWSAGSIPFTRIQTYPPYVGSLRVRPTVVSGWWHAESTAATPARIVTAWKEVDEDGNWHEVAGAKVVSRASHEGEVKSQPPLLPQVLLLVTATAHRHTSTLKGGRNRCCVLCIPGNVYFGTIYACYQLCVGFC